MHVVMTPVPPVPQWPVRWLARQFAQRVGLPLVAVACAACQPKTLGGECMPPTAREYDLAKTPSKIEANAPMYDLKDDLLVRYLGGGGVLLEWKMVGVVSSPLLTPYSKLALTSGKVEPDKAAIERVLSGITRDGVQAILVGSGGAEHMADLVQVASQLPLADIFVNQSGANMLAPYEEQLEKNTVKKKTRKIRVINGENNPRIAEQWAWLRDGDNETAPIRIHALHMVEDRPLKQEEPLGVDWDAIKMSEFYRGERFAFIVDLFEDDRSTLSYRVLVADAGASIDWEKAAQGEEAPWDDGTIDLAVVSLREGQDRPAKTLVQRSGARHAVLVGYDSRRGDTLVLDPALNEESFSAMVCAASRNVSRSGDRPKPDRKGIDGVKGSGWTMPLPGEWLVFPTKEPEPEPAPAPAAAEGEAGAEAAAGEGKAGGEAAAEDEKKAAKPKKKPQKKKKAKPKKDEKPEEEVMMLLEDE